MVTSVNSKGNQAEFDKLLASTTAELNRLAVTKPNEMLKFKGADLEEPVRDIMLELAQGTTFDKSIIITKAQEFPDIVANKYFGVEVKTSNSKNWKSTGNSILESRRISDVERIYMLFGKMKSPIEYKSRPYEECLYNIGVTHQPRYMIDMNLAQGDTIFDKMGITYDVLRKNDPVKTIKEYYRQTLKPGQELWWIGQSDVSSNFIVSHWSELEKDEQNRLRIQAMCLFPEIFGGDNRSKFKRIALWMVTNESVLFSRDPFTASGQVPELRIKGKKYLNVPRIFDHLLSNLESIIEALEDFEPEIIKYYWKSQAVTSGLLNAWIEMVHKHALTFLNAKHLNIRKMIKARIKELES